MDRVVRVISNRSVGSVNLTLPGGSWCNPELPDHAAAVVLRQCASASDRMEVEDIVDGGMHAQEALSRGR